jgi:hypothetical protein
MCLPTTSSHRSLISILLRLHLHLGPPSCPFSSGFPTKIMHAFHISTIIATYFRRQEFWRETFLPSFLIQHINISAFFFLCYLTLLVFVVSKILFCEAYDTHIYKKKILVFFVHWLSS